MAFVQLWGLPVVKISAQSDVVYWSYCPQTPSFPPHKKLPNGVLNQKKKLLFLLGKVETNKYPEAETWHRWMVLLQAIWEFLDVAQGVIYKFEPKNLILQEFCYFLGPGGLHYLILLRCFLPETLVLINIFGFPAVNWVPKWIKNSKFWRIFQTLCLPCWKTTSGQNISNIIHLPKCWGVTHRV